jgi:hypothetical protein
LEVKKVELLERVKLWLGWCPRAQQIEFQKKEKKLAMAESNRGEGLITERTVIHEEMAPYTTTMRVILLGVFLFTAAATFLSLSWTSIYETGTPETFRAFRPLALLTAVIGLVLWSFFNIRFRLTTEGIEGVMYPFIFKVNYGDIKDVRVIDKIPWYVGWGVRIWGRRLAYVSMHKPAVAIEKKKGFFRTLILTTRDPEIFAGMIKERMRSAHS